MSVVNKPKKKMNHAPERIFLNDPENNFEEKVEDIFYSGITWSDEKIDEKDVGYVRANVVSNICTEIILKLQRYENQRTGMIPLDNTRIQYAFVKLADVLEAIKTINK